jgi:hypothetical protein
MKQALIRAGLTLSMALASSAGWAAAPDLTAKQQQWAISGDIVQQRKDVDEISRPPPPTGPATTTLCSPSSPVCP